MGSKKRGASKKRRDESDISVYASEEPAAQRQRTDSVTEERASEAEDAADDGSPDILGVLLGPGQLLERLKACIGQPQFFYADRFADLHGLRLSCKHLSLIHI